LSHVGIESTIVDLSRLDQGIGPVLLRPGHVTAAQIAAVLGVEPGRPDAAAPQVSGSLKAHYAPHTPLSLLPLPQLLSAVDAAKADAGRVAAVVFHKPQHGASANVDWHLCATEPDAYARDLYALLRRLDQQGYASILLEQPPQTPAWQAVNDRIGRAAAAFSSL
ncbi:MAG TPA: Sua5 family C-terminal domain-containing protein, partial [Candidimonas sp.]|nr:Sua5 family C-terminal domain-containing protein [Candidimonas sp.]